MGRPQAPSSDGLLRATMATSDTKLKDGHAVPRGAVRHHPVGKITGKGTGTSDEVPIDASNGEFILKAKAVKKIGIEALEAFNAIADGPDEKDSKAEKRKEYGDAESKSEDKGEAPGMEMKEKMPMKCGGAVRKMAAGGLVDEDARRAALLAQTTAPQVEGQGGYLPNESVMGRAGRRISEAGSGFVSGMKSIGQAMNLSAPGAATGMPFNSSAGAGRGAVPSGAPTGINEPSPVAAPSAIPTVAAAVPALPGSPAAVAAGAATTPDIADSNAILASENQRRNASELYNEFSNASTLAQNPGGAVRKITDANGKVTGYSGGNISGDVSMTDASGAPIRGNTRGISSMDTSAGYAEDLKQLAEIDKAKAEQNTNIQGQADYAAMRAGQISPKAYQAILAANKADQTTRRGQDVQAGATRANYQLAQDRLGLEKAKDSRDATAAGFSTRAAGRLETLYAAYETAKPQDKAGIAEQLRVLTGKDKPAQWKAIALQGSTDSMGNKTESVLAGVNEQTGEVRRLDQGGAAALPPGMVKQVGTSNGKPVYEDANGKQHF